MSLTSPDVLILSPACGRDKSDMQNRLTQHRLVGPLGGPHMSPFIRLAALAAMVALAGCGTQTVLLESQGEYLLTAMDQLALPGEPVELSARLQTGDFLSSKPGCIVRFDWEGQPYCTSETNVHGLATATFVPPKTGDYFFDADVMPAGLPADPPRSRTLSGGCEAG